jgi:hypothetical protein
VQNKILLIAGWLSSLKPRFWGHLYALSADLLTGSDSTQGTHLFGKHWRELGLVAEILEPFELKVQESLDKGSSFLEQVTYPTVFGERTYEYSLNPVRDDSGDVGCVLAIVRAITSR